MSKKDQKPEPKKKLEESQKIFGDDEVYEDPFGEDGKAQSYNPNEGKNLIDMQGDDDMAP
jgi:hypothetical protein